MSAAYLTFAAALARKFTAAGISFEKDPKTETGIAENEKWVNFSFGGSGHKLYVPKNKRELGNLQCTIEFPLDLPGVVPLPPNRKGEPYRNGAIRSHLSPDVERVAVMVIDALTSGAPVPQKRAPASRKAVEAETQQQR